MALEYKDLDGLLKPVIMCDGFEPKMGEPADVCVLSFFVRDETAANDLMSWFEKGYDEVLDADMSPGEIKPGRFLVYVEIRRKSSMTQLVWQLLSDLNTLCEFEPDDWTVVYRKKEFPFDKQEFAERVATTPKEYHREVNHDLNEVRISAGLPPVTYIDKADPYIQSIQSAAGIL